MCFYKTFSCFENDEIVSFKYQKIGWENVLLIPCMFTCTLNHYLSDVSSTVPIHCCLKNFQHVKKNLVVIFSLHSLVLVQESLAKQSSGVLSMFFLKLKYKKKLKCIWLAIIPIKQLNSPVEMGIFNENILTIF